MTETRPTLLVVDDAVSIIDILIDALGGDYTMRVATNGTSALNSLQKARPDLVLLDIMMPGMDGFEVCRRLKDDPETRDIPIIFLTALNEDGDETRGLELGAVDYITKPFNPAIVRARVRNHLELNAQREHLAALAAEREKIIQELKRAIEQVKTLKGIVPICASCKKIRDDKGYWEQVESYVSRHTEAEFSHGICPDCMKALYPEFFKDKKD